MTKYINKFIFVLILIVILTITYLSFFGIKTDRFNEAIFKNVLKINKNLNLSLGEVSYFLNPVKFNIIISTENPKILLVGQPTRGVDIGAIEFIHQRLIDMRNKGVAILLVSVELEEVLSLSDRIVVMFDGKIVGEKVNKDVTDREIGLLMAGIA